VERRSDRQRTYTGATLVNSNSTLEFGSGGASLIPPTFFTVTNNGTVGFNLSAPCC